MWPHSLMRRLFSERMLLCSVSHASSFVRMNIDKSLNTTWFRILCCSGKRLQVLVISFIRIVSDSRMALSHPLKALVRSCSDTHTHTRTLSRARRVACCATHATCQLPSYACSQKVHVCGASCLSVNVFLWEGRRSFPCFSNFGRAGLSPTVLRAITWRSCVENRGNVEPCSGRGWQMPQSPRG